MTRLYHYISGMKYPAIGDVFTGTIEFFMFYISFVFTIRSNLMPSNYCVVPPKCTVKPYVCISKSNEETLPRCERIDLTDLKVGTLDPLRWPPSH